MEKFTKNARIADLESKLMVMQTQINSLIECGHSHTKRLVALEPDNPFHGKFYEPSEPKPKQLDQSVFDGLDAKWRFAAVDNDGRAYGFMKKPVIDQDDPCFIDENATRCKWIGEGYDASNWQNSLIERESKEITGSDLCRYIKSRKHWVLAVVSDENDATAEFHQRAIVVTGITSDGRFKCGDMTWRYAVPIDHKGEPLAQSDVGL